MINRIYNELKKRIEDAGFNEITIEMKVNGDKIIITPCKGYQEGPKNWDNIEYFLLDSQFINLLGEDTLMKVAETIAHYEDYLKESNDGIDSLKAHIREHGEASDWDFISDYHKDLFGHRPHIPHDQIIAWAYSDSRESARYYA